MNVRGDDFALRMAHMSKLLRQHRIRKKMHAGFVEASGYNYRQQNSVVREMFNHCVEMVCIVGVL